MKEDLSEPINIQIKAAAPRVDHTILVSESASNHDQAFLMLIQSQVRDRLRERGHDPGLILIQQKDEKIELKTVDGSSINDLLGYEMPDMDLKAADYGDKVNEPRNRQERRAMRKGRR